MASPVRPEHRHRHHDLPGERSLREQHSQPGPAPMDVEAGSSPHIGRGVSLSPNAAGPGRTAKLVRTEIRRAVASEYRREVLELLRWRHIWKKLGDASEAIAKGLGGASTVLAFAASSNADRKTTDILAFVSGCVGTLSLVLMGYSTYATRESRQRTAEMNSMLHALDITPVPDIASQDMGGPSIGDA